VAKLNVTRSIENSASTAASCFGKRQAWAAGMLLISMAIVVYWPALNGGYVLDDDDYLINNVHLRSLDGLGRIWLHPNELPDHYSLTYTTFWLEYHLWGLEPLGYHVVNVMLHAASALLLWRLLIVLRVPGAWVAAAIFAVHPVCVESVAWITERKNVLSMLTALASMLCYLRFEPAEETTDQMVGNRTRWTWYVCSIVLFGTALFSKTVVVMMPAALVVIYWWKRGRIDRQIVVPLVPLFFLALAMAVVTIHVEATQNGAHGGEWSFSLIERFLIAGRAVWFYAGKLIWPHPLAFVYSRWTIDSAALWQMLYPASVVGVVGAVWLTRCRIGRGPIAAVAIYVIALFPVLGIFNIAFTRYSFVADHFQYHAAAAIAALVGAGIWSVFSAKRLVVARGTAAGVVLGAFMVLSLEHSALFADPIRLYTDTIKRNSDCWMAHFNLGNALVQAGRNQDAAVQFAETVKLKPECAEAHNNLGKCLAASGQKTSATHEFEATVALLPENAGAHFNLAGLQFESGLFSEAAEHYRIAVKENPEWMEGWMNLAVTYLQLHRDADARSSAGHALQLADASGQAAQARKIRAFLDAHPARVAERTERNSSNSSAQ
jgi:Tfp pilus assembly protein PilF